MDEGIEGVEVKGVVHYLYSFYVELALLVFDLG